MVTPSIAFRAEPDRHDLKISPSNLGKGARGGFTCSAANVKLELCFGFTAGPLPHVTPSPHLRPHVTPKWSSCRHAVRSLRNGSSSQISGSRR
ncbi:hypothetical protein T03_1981 [Trichinella britovi]|uniref:Uncharacterized protein n=1 Tax=Trichinella britovi TaxID=45882 RepID=A0A0V1ALQ1_TRIBR|nr:hypothetical protein T03_1981 [Trichinella britovi]